MTSGEPLVEQESSFVSVRKLLVFVFAAMIIYLIMLFYSRFEEVVSVMSSLELWWVIPVMISLSFLNYIIRYFKWQYYLHRIDVNMSHADSFSTFLAGFTLTVSPGKIGEAIKGYFCKDLEGAPVAKTVPVVISERVTDLLAMVILAGFAFLAVFTGGNQLFLIIISGALVFFGALMLTRPAFYDRILKRMMSIGPLKRFEESCDQIEDTMVKTLSPKPMLLGTAVSIPGWFMECLELWLLLGLMTGQGLPSFTVGSIMLLAQATFIHAGASAVGAVLFFLPAGLGGYEVFAAYMITLLVVNNPSIAIAATLIIRFVTLWFSVIVGFIALAVVTKRIRDRECSTLPQA